MQVTTGQPATVSRYPTAVAVVPAKNEAPTVAGVVSAIAASPLIREVVVVSDGSTDATANRARQAGADRVVELPFSVGKGGAMRLGAALTGDEVVAFFDGDLVGLTPKHVSDVVAPVLAGVSTMNVGLRDRGSWNPVVDAFPHISGQRAVRRAFLNAVPPEEMQGFRAEIAMNHWADARSGARRTAVRLPGLNFRRKFEKKPPADALADYVSMWAQVVGAAMDLALRDGGNRRQWTSDVNGAG